PPIPPILTSSHHHHDKTHHLLLAATGSVATIKLPQIILSLSHHTNLSIRLILTKSSIEFLRGQASEQPTLAQIFEFPNVEAIYVDEDEWRRPWTRGASILHIELRKWADLMVIAPLSANALAKVALGMSDNLVYSVVRAWDTTGLIDEARPGVRKKGIIVAPAMNTAMWNHPVTKRHLDVLEGEWNVANGGWMEVLGPIDKGLACGDKGGGGMREWKEIVEVIEKRMGLS
ncbi:phosphopantothenoylcysteine decarboxylase, partial [Sphaerulina musiva SO2202]